MTKYIAELYSAEEDHPWMKYPEHTVFRHQGNRKWFALVMDVPKSRLGIPGNGRIDILNVKCDPRLIGSLRTEQGFYPAYHMNKTSWITIALDGRADDEKVKWLLDMSFALTAPGRKVEKKRPEGRSKKSPRKPCFEPFARPAPAHAVPPALFLFQDTASSAKKPCFPLPVIL